MEVLNVAKCKKYIQTNDAEIMAHMWGEGGISATKLVHRGSNLVADYASWGSTSGGFSMTRTT